MKQNLKKVLINLAAAILLLVGLTQILGYVFNVPLLKGIGFASVIAPFPKVFSDVEGLETFASEFTLLLANNNKVSELKITPELYSKFAGPYNRRNVYGAALAYAPRLKKEIWEMVLCYAFYKPAVLRNELNISSNIKNISVQINTKTKGRTDKWQLNPRCLK